MRVNVKVEITTTNDDYTTITIDEKDYEEWLNEANDTHSVQALKEYLECGDVGTEIVPELGRYYGDTIVERVSIESVEVIDD